MLHRKYRVEMLQYRVRSYLAVEKIGSGSVAVLSHVAHGLGRSMLHILSAFNANIE